ncbi:hypothetical protein P344_01275 [Spiroplasma mirum ATCC 29335]|uniref:Uncharacterized protein n=1 Tax=Spiroplasma mirum ATCC 29335 TaxID=838561 RepID=W0GQ54_9MOLU|nr:MULTISPECIES: hypothetical protein [Spiroplasma]AHF60661.1 hypothetical protein SMM_0204 [Spiroplasma mirum ATCC 29335]AHI57620.1 hypothetical protein P344_01275 [Spiroplasma mirum ATCC 29335]AKM52806.1 hypothetical protein SATRI_v1c02470 [Spiroplasma atrichopogonis]
MDTVLKLFDKNSLDSMVKLLSTFLPTTKTEGQRPYGLGNLNMIYKDYAFGIIVNGDQGMFLNAVYKVAENDERKQKAIALYGQDLYTKLFGNPDNNSIVDEDGNKALWNKSDTKKWWWYGIIWANY